jgi:hypothetical protein
MWKPTWMRPDATLVVRDTTDELGTMWRAVRLHGNGMLSILGHDIGPGVEEVFGCREYEFARQLSKQETATLRTAMGLPRRGDLLAAITTRFATTQELEQFLAEHDIRGSFWNRVGE